jgi:hypothetical protein
VAIIGTIRAVTQTLDTHGSTTTVERDQLQPQPQGEVQGGFVFELSHSPVGKGDGTPLRFFAVPGNVATDLSYAPGFPWQARR